MEFKDDATSWYKFNAAIDATADYTSKTPKRYLSLLSCLCCFTHDTVAPLVHRAGSVVFPPIAQVDLSRFFPCFPYPHFVLIVGTVSLSSPTHRDSIVPGTPFSSSPPSVSSPIADEKRQKIVTSGNLVFKYVAELVFSPFFFHREGCICQMDSFPTDFGMRPRRCDSTWRYCAENEVSIWKERFLMIWTGMCWIWRLQLAP